MAWIVPRDWVASEVVTAAVMNSAVRDNLRYLKGLDGDITLEANVLTAFLVDGVDVSAHKARHASGGADALNAPLAIAAMAGLTLNKVWKGDATNRPVEIDFPTRTLNPANDTVQEGYYAATTLSAVDADLAVGNIKSGVTIFGFLGTFTETLAEDIVDSVISAVTQDATSAITINRKNYAQDADTDQDLASSTQTFAAVSLAVASAFINCFNVDTNQQKLRVYMDGVSVAESGFLADGEAADAVGSRALSGVDKICKASVHNYGGDGGVLQVMCENSGAKRAIAFVSVGSVKKI